MNQPRIIYDDPTEFTKLRPVGTISYSILDPFASSLKLLTQSYVVRGDSYRPPAYGTSHQSERQASLVDISPSRDIGGGLIKITCTFALGAPVTFERSTSRTYEFPGIKIPQVNVQEQYLETYELPRREWKTEIIDIPGFPGQPGGGFQVNFIKEASRLASRQIVIPDLILREPKSSTVNVTEEITYCTTAMPAGVSITGQGVDTRSFVRNRYSTRRNNNADAQLGIPDTFDAFEIFGNTERTAQLKIEQQMKDQLHPASINTDYQVPNIRESAERTNYLSEYTTPSTNSYFAQPKIFLESTSIQQVRGCLYKYTNITTQPK
jgi:hypothetical protein